MKRKLPIFIIVCGLAFTSSFDSIIGYAALGMLMAMAAMWLESIVKPETDNHEYKKS